MLYAFKEAKANGKEKKMEKIFAENEQARDIWAKFTSGESRISVLAMGGKSSYELLRHFDEWQGDGVDRLKEALKKEENSILSDAHELCKALIPIKKWLRNRSLNIPEQVEKGSGFFEGMITEVKKFVGSKIDKTSDEPLSPAQIQTEAGNKKERHRRKKEEEAKPPNASNEGAGSQPASTTNEREEKPLKAKKRHKKAKSDENVKDQKEEEAKPNPKSKKRHHHHSPPRDAQEQGGLIGSLMTGEGQSSEAATRPVVNPETRTVEIVKGDEDQQNNGKKKPCQDRYDVMTPLELFEQVVLVGDLSKIKMMIKILDLTREEALWKRVLTALKFDNMDVLKLVRKDMNTNELIEFQSYCLKKKGNERACDYLKGLDPDADAAKKRAREAALKRK
jgi:hypothetical protein